MGTHQPNPEFLRKLTLDVLFNEVDDESKSESLLFELVGSKLGPGDIYQFGLKLLKDRLKVSQITRRIDPAVSLELALIDLTNKWQDTYEDSPTWAEFLDKLKLFQNYNEFSKSLMRKLKIMAIDISDNIRDDIFMELVIQNKDLPVTNKETLQEFVIRVYGLSTTEFMKATVSSSFNIGHVAMELISKWRTVDAPDSSAHSVYEAMKSAHMGQADIKCFIDTMAQKYPQYVMATGVSLATCTQHLSEQKQLESSDTLPMVVNVDTKNPGTPQNMTVAFQTATTACVSWEEPTDSGDSPLTGYTLEMKYPGNQEWETIQTNGLKNECTVKNLKEGQKYVFRVAAVNYHEYMSDFGQHQDPVGFKLSMPSKPINLTAAYIDDQCLELKWETPECDGESSISGYRLDIHDCSGITETREIPADIMQYRIQNQSPEKPYVYYVYAVNQRGHSTYAKCTVLTPPAPIVADSTKTSMTFKWSKPDTKKVAMGISRYIFDILGENGSRITYKLPRHQNEFTADNLVEGRWYEFRLAAEYSGGCGPFAKYVVLPFYSTKEKFKKSYRHKFSKIYLDPSDTSISVPTSEFYLELAMQQIDHKGFNQLVPIETYRDVFAMHGGPHRIGLYAFAGCGKTTLCKVIPFCWADEDVLAKEYKYVFFLNLRGHCLEDDVAQMIVDEANLKEEKHAVQEIIQREKGNVLFVLDGFDEVVESEATNSNSTYNLKDLLTDDSQHIIVSTRPSQLEELVKMAWLTLKLKILGLSEEQAVQFIINYCSQRNITYTKDSSQLIQEVIMEQLHNKRLVSLSTNPQQLQLVCDYMRSNTEISGSLTELYNQFYDSTVEAFLKKVGRDDKCDAKIKEEILSQETHEELLRNLEHLALEGFCRGRLIYDEKAYLKMLQKRFVTVFDKLGAVFFEKSPGSERKVLGFKHKTYQEFFASRFLYPYLLKACSEHPEIVKQVLEQWKDAKKAVRYERIFVFMAGMATDEKSAKKIMDYITGIIKQLPNYFESESSIELQDLEDLPRQLLMMQVKAALEVKAAGKCEGSCYFDALLEALPYGDDSPLPDVNTEQKEEEDVELPLATLFDATSGVSTTSYQPRHDETELSRGAGTHPSATENQNPAKKGTFVSFFKKLVTPSKKKKVPTATLR